jgi:hypothetical protein
MSTFILHNTLLSKEDADLTNIKYNIMPVDSNTYKRLLYNKLHEKLCFQVSVNKIKEEFNIIIDDSKDSTNIINIINIIPMPELNKNQVEIYLSTFIDEVDNLDAYAEYLAIIAYNQVSPYKFHVKKHLEKLLESQSSYWEDETNCMLTINDIFTKRKFNHDLITGTLTKSSEINQAKQISNSLDKINHDDLNDLNEYSRDINSLDIATNTSHYYLSTNTNSKMSTHNVNLIFKQLPTEYLKYNFLANLICTRTHCHLVLNNKELLIEANPIINKYKPVFKYLIGYAWLTFRQEETIKKSKITEQDRIVLDLDTATELPFYPFGLDDINQNPYASIMLDDKLMELENNCVAMRMIRTNPEKYYGVCNSETFIKRMNIFVNGFNKRGILDQIDWKHFAITGSAMTACGMKYNPLFDLYRANSNSGDISDQEFSTYLFHYYNNSDIDLVCNHKSIFDFLDATNTIIEMLQIEYKTQMKLTQVHTASICMSDEFISSELEELTKLLVVESSAANSAATSNSVDSDNSNKFIPTITVEYIKRNYSNPIIRAYFYNKYYVVWKLEQNDQIKLESSPFLTKITQPVYTEYLRTIPPNEFRLYNLDYDIDSDNYNKQDYEKYFYGDSLTFGNTNPKKLICKLNESIRFQIKSNRMNRSWEIFKTRDTNFFSTVSKFHMGFVRALYNGKTALCLPSFISAMMLQLSTDYKYFASIRNPIEIINKYRSRGFGIILNDDEKIHFAYYNSFKPDTDMSDSKESESESTSNKWYLMYKVDIKDKSSINAIFGPKSVNDVIFKPSKFFDGITDDCFKTVEHQYINKAAEAFDKLYTSDTKSLYQLKCINSKGTVNPLNREIIKTSYDLINKAKTNPNQNVINPIEVD